MTRSTMQKHPSGGSEADFFKKNVQKLMPWYQSFKLKWIMRCHKYMTNIWLNFLIMWDTMGCDDTGCELGAHGILMMWTMYKGMRGPLYKSCLWQQSGGRVAGLNQQLGHVLAKSLINWSISVTSCTFLRLALCNYPRNGPDCNSAKLTLNQSKSWKYSTKETRN